ncbi:MAG: DivIVA domain-containing protein, partial [Clostridia bacterium]
MANEIFRREGKKGYNSDEVDAFLNELNAKRRIFAEEKESEIKRLTSEKEQLSEQLIEENKQ